MESPVFIALSVLGAGIAVGLQSPMVGILSSRLGTLEAIFIVHIGGAVASVLPLLLLRGGGKLGQLTAVPWYTLLAGVLGLVVVAAIGYAVPRIGAGATTVLLVAAQLLAATLADQFGWFGIAVKPLDLGKVLGLGLLLAGAWLVVRPN
ncbi:DMT family transporter [Calidithermus chliarophilus]|uniref:DMT family transporter n=1 Tax=Calidithermus chliarophilus TaxID=52023 RepID=UPI0004827EAA|nr:DMT family transporter [Calidithermus chliarophilus]